MPKKFSAGESRRARSSESPLCEKSSLKMSTAASEGKSEASRGSAPLTPPEKASKSLTFLKSAKANTPKKSRGNIRALIGGRGGAAGAGGACFGGSGRARKRRQTANAAEASVARKVGRTISAGEEDPAARRKERAVVLNSCTPAALSTKSMCAPKGLPPSRKTAGRLDAEGRGRAGEAQKVGGDRAAGGGERLFVVRAEEPAGGGAHGACKESGEPALFHHAEKAQPHAVGGGEREGERHRLFPARKERGQEPLGIEDEKTQKRRK